MLEYPDSGGCVSVQRAVISFCTYYSQLIDPLCPLFSLAACTNNSKPNQQ
jgi:hypothetical protein